MTYELEILTKFVSKLEEFLSKPFKYIGIQVVPESQRAMRQ